MIQHYTRIAVIGPAGYTDPPESISDTAVPRRRFLDVEIDV